MITVLIGLSAGCTQEAANPPVAKPADPAQPANNDAAKPAQAVAEPAAPESAPATAVAAANTPSAPAPQHPLDKTAPLIPRDVLFGNPDKAMARMSHDAKRLAYLAPVKNQDGDGVLNVLVGPIDDFAAAKPVTHETARPIGMYFWAYTNKHILYIQDDKGDENFHVYAVNLDTGETKDITPLDADKAVDEKGEKKKVRAEIEGVSWRNPEEVIIGLNDRDPRYHDLYLVNINTGDHKLLLQNTDFSGFEIDEDYKVRFASKMTEDGGSELFEPDGSGGWKSWMKIDKADGLTTGPSGFDKTGDLLYFMDSRGRGTGELKTINLKTGEEKLIAEDPLSDVGGVMAHPTENTIQGVAFVYDRTKWKFFDKDVEADFNRLKQVADGEIEIVSRTLDDRKWLVGIVTDDGPVRYYFYDRDTKEPKFLFTNRKELEGQPLVKMHPVIIDARDGLKLVSYLSLPPGSDPNNTGRPDKPVPMVLDVHGGPWARDGWGLNAEHQLWANRGYAVLCVNYRGSTGFGKNFVNAGNKEWAAKMHDDLIDAVNWAVKEKIADPSKIAIVGGSYGGYATLVGLTFTPDVFACGVDECGPSNLITLMENPPPYWLPDMPLFKDRVGDYTTDEGKKFLWEHSPLSKANQIKRPLLIGQGAHDPRVKQKEADQIAKAMEDKHIPVTYVLMSDEGHGFERPENEMAFIAVTEAFLAKNLGGRAEPIGNAFEGSTIAVPAGADDVAGVPEALKAMAAQPATQPSDAGAADAKPDGSTNKQ